MENADENEDISDGEWEAESDETSVKDSDDQASIDDKTISTIVQSEPMKDLAVIADWEAPTEYGENVDADFMTFMDREKSKGKGLLFPFTPTTYRS